MNDHSPEFRSIPRPISASESDVVGKTLATLAADDEDEGNNGEISFYLVGNGNGTKFFQVGPWRKQCEASVSDSVMALLYFSSGEHVHDLSAKVPLENENASRY